MVIKFGPEESSDKVYRFEPGDNISAPELAKLFPYLVAAWAKNDYSDVTNEIPLSVYNVIPVELREKYFR